MAPSTITVVHGAERRMPDSPPEIASRALAVEGRSGGALWMQVVGIGALLRLGVRVSDCDERLPQMGVMLDILEHVLFQEIQLEPTMAAG
eukprot:CAMPEP_0172167180 /NCGR_PEP_ID=MMETSP1050-20130122/9425_1 /TAXON_ID=233186 /ORGANISM="Cryptomonas curvata, Strain CCAP979/52" /LENGTH=89 /DNA_ID=CAMNT_0012837935 /DNA_START=319 /DNA_END=585 /DNA_ORIENTATION=+